MAVMIVREESPNGSSEFELNRDNLRRIQERTGRDFADIYTVLNSGEVIEEGGTRWRMVRQ